MLLACLLLSARIEAATLYVNVAIGNDATSKAANNSGSQWASIYRASKGCALASAPCSSAGEAATAGDTLVVTGGTYTYAGAAVNNRFTPLYNPTNQGTLGNPIRFTCVGTCILIAESVMAPAIGASAKDYIEWYADITAGSAWVINACHESTGTCTGGFSTHDDTGPVVCHDASPGCTVEGATIRGLVPAPVGSTNWSGLRAENTSECVFRNNTVEDFTRDGGSNHNQALVILYGASDCLIEHNNFDNSGAGVYFKDTAISSVAEDNIIRLNKLTNLQVGVAWSFVGGTSTEGRNFIYQNTIATVSAYCFNTISDADDGPSGDWIYNNTCTGIGTAAVLLTSTGLMSGVSIWNNIFLTSADMMLTANNDPWPAASVVSTEHNVYRTHSGNFYEGPDGSLATLAAFKAVYTDEDSAVPISITSDPLLANVAGGDYRLCTGAAAPVAGCAGSSPAINLGRTLDGGATVNAGAYITNLECIGLESACSVVTPTWGRLRRDAQ